LTSSSSSSLGIAKTSFALLSLVRQFGKAQINLSEDNFVVTHQRNKFSLYSLLQNLAFHSIICISGFAEDTLARK
jgi:hypothetical protein